MSTNVGYLGKAPWNKDEINNAEDLWASATRYVDWSYSSPLVEAKLFSTKTGLLSGTLDKLRPLTLEAFCNYIGITMRKWNSWKTRAIEESDEQFFNVMELLESNFNDQLFQGAAVGFFSTTMISRKLGLVEKTEVQTAVIKADPSEGKEQHLAINIHPDDPDPLDLPRPLYSLAQIEAGIEFTPPRRAAFDSEQEGDYNAGDA